MHNCIYNFMKFLDFLLVTLFFLICNIAYSANLLACLPIVYL